MISDQVQKEYRATHTVEQCSLPTFPKNVDIETILKSTWIISEYHTHRIVSLAFQFIPANMVKLQRSGKCSKNSYSQNRGGGITKLKNFRPISMSLHLYKWFICITLEGQNLNREASRFRYCTMSVEMEVKGSQAG